MLKKFLIIVFLSFVLAFTFNKMLPFQPWKLYTFSYLCYQGTSADNPGACVRNNGFPFYAFTFSEGRHSKPEYANVSLGGVIGNSVVAVFVSYLVYYLANKLFKQMKNRF